MISADIQVDVPAMTDDDGNCEKCSHPFGPHVLMATMITADHGGMIFCHLPGCKCQSTWSIEGQPMPYIPDEETVAELRRIAQSDEEPESPDDDWHVEGDIDIWQE